MEEGICSQRGTVHGHAFLQPDQENNDPGEENAGQSFRRDGQNHWFVDSDNHSMRCRLCIGMYTDKCSKCNVGLHHKCFIEYHIAT